jgi:hypothetical protein
LMVRMPTKVGDKRGQRMPALRTAGAKSTPEAISTAAGAMFVSQ